MSAVIIRTYSRRKVRRFMRFSFRSVAIWLIIAVDFILLGTHLGIPAPWPGMVGGLAGILTVLIVEKYGWD